MEKKTYTIIPLAVALVASLFMGIQPDPTHQCEAELTHRYCFDISGGLHTRCYLTPEKDSWDYCKTGWQPVQKWAGITVSDGTEYKVVDGMLEKWKRISRESIDILNIEKSVLAENRKQLDDISYLGDYEQFCMVMCLDGYYEGLNKKECPKTCADEVQIELREIELQKEIFDNRILLMDEKLGMI